MGKMQRDKGYRIERKTIAWLKAHDIESRRVPLSGGVKDWPFDLWIEGNVMAEVKGRATATGSWATPKKWLAADDADVLFLWEDRAEAPLVMLPGKIFAQLFQVWRQTQVGGGIHEVRGDQTEGRGVRIVAQDQLKDVASGLRVLLDSLGLKASRPPADKAVAPTRRKNKKTRSDKGKLKQHTRQWKLGCFMADRKKMYTSIPEIIVYNKHAKLFDTNRLAMSAVYALTRTGHLEMCGTRTSRKFRVTEKGKQACQGRV